MSMKELGPGTIAPELRAVITLDPSGKVRTWNRDAQTLTGYSFIEMDGRHLSSLSFNPSAANIPAHFESAQKHGSTSWADRVIRKDGSTIPVRWSLYFESQEANGHDGFSCVVEEISTRTSPPLVQSLMASLHLLSSMTDSLEVLIKQVTPMIASQLGWPLAHSYIFDEESQSMVSSKSWYDNGYPGQFDVFRAASESMTMAPGVGLPGRVYANREAVLVTDLPNDQNFPRNKFLNNLPIETALGIPVIADGKVIAALEFFTESRDIDSELVSHLGEAIRQMIAEFMERRRQTEEQEFFFKMSHDILCLVGYDGFFKRTSPSWTTILGHMPEEVLQIPWPEFVHPDDLEHALNAGKNQIEATASVSIELRFKHKNGTYRWIQWYSVPLADRQMIYAVGRDVTEKKESDRQLQETLALQTAILNGSGYGIICVGLNGLVTVFNQGAEKLTGYSADQYVGRPNPPRLTDPETLQERARDLSNVIGKPVQADVYGFMELAKTGIHHQFEWTYIRRDGTRFPALLEVSPLRNQSGELTGYMGVIQDISKRREAEIAQARLLAIIEESPDLIGFADDSGQILYQNKGGNRMLGYDDNADPNLFSTAAAPSWANQIDWDRVLDDIQNKGFWRGESTLRHREGYDIPVSQVLVRLPSSDKRNFIATMIRDMTEMKQAEEQLERNAIDLRHSNEELEQFAYVASHDLQEPLRMVCSFLGLLELEFDDQLNDDAREYIRYAVDGGMRMRALIDGLLDFSRVGRQTIEFKPLNMESILTEVLFGLQIAMGEARATITHDPLPHTLGDHVSIARLIQNLISNSLKFRTDEPVQIHISAEVKEEMIQFSVQDNGIGIDPKHGEKIFHIFQRLHPKSEYPGSGIGLSICKKIVERHGGKLWLDTSDQRGAKFSFTLKPSK